MKSTDCPCVKAETPKCSAGNACWHFTNTKDAKPCGFCGQRKDPK